MHINGDDAREDAKRRELKVLTEKLGREEARKRAAIATRLSPTKQRTPRPPTGARPAGTVGFQRPNSAAGREHAPAAAAAPPPPPVAAAVDGPPAPQQQQQQQQQRRGATNNTSPKRRGGGGGGGPPPRGGGAHSARDRRPRAPPAAAYRGAMTARPMTAPKAVPMGGSLPSGVMARGGFRAGSS